jgi:polar amino acid transport system ATP-binding protein
MSLLQIDDLSKSFKEKQVLRNISFGVEKGEVVAIIGPSGSGKTTLLRCAAMLENADGGNLTLGGIPVFKNGEYAPKAILKQARGKCGMVFQAFNLFPHMSVLNNIIDAPVHVLGIDRETAVAEAMRLLKKMDLADHSEAYPCELSGGQQQRVAIARALALQPEVLCFDEPTSALDPELTGEVLRVIRGLKSDDTTMIVVTHEMDFAKSVADVVIYMADGVIEEIGTPAQIFDDPQSPKTKAFIRGVQEAF